MATGTEMAAGFHPEATGHLPSFITAPGATDWFLVASGIFLLAAIVGIGVFYLKLHHLPDHLAHGGQKIQYEIVAVLCLIALFTHNHAFWIAALLLAMLPIPNFTTPLRSMARSLVRMSRRPEDAPPPAGPSGGTER